MITSHHGTKENNSKLKPSQIKYSKIEKKKSTLINPMIRKSHILGIFTSI